MDFQEEKIPYLKKKESNTSKANKKSKHKHIYDKQVIFEYTNTKHNIHGYEVYEYCSECGKIESLNWKDWKEYLKEQRYNWDLEEHKKHFPNAIHIKLPNNIRAFFDIKNINEVLKDGE